MKQLIQIHKPRWKHAAVYGFPIIISVLFAFLYVGMQMHGLYGGDAGDLTTNAFIFGIPHAPGYPLYTFLAGGIAHLVPWDSVEWRVCLMSSIPSALALFFLWRICFRFTKSLFASTIATVLYGVCGPVWLGAITQEVFGLFTFFSAVWVERFLTWQEEKKEKQLVFLAFWTGLALTHHSLIILCIVPACFLVFFRLRDHRKQCFHIWWKAIIAGSLGLIPYIYLPIASFIGTPFDQEHASTLYGFFRLVTRASYGSFRASAGATPRLIDRMLNIFTFFQFSVRDISLIGCILICIGVIVLRKKNRTGYDYMIGCLFLWIFYFFYAGFSQLLNYQIGTLERFFVIPYQFFYIFMAIGISSVIAYLRATCVKKWMYIVSVCLCSLVIVGFFQQRIRTNFQAFSFLRHDTSMETLAHDMLLSAPPGSILFLTEDTTIYTMYDALYVHRLRPDIHFIRLQLFGLPYYRAYLRKAYPDLYMPREEPNVPTATIVADFLTHNMQTFSIMSDQVPSTIDGLWLPYGLLYSYFPDKNGTLDYQALYAINTDLWKQFSPPEILLSYQKELPMLSDVLRVYSQHEVNAANVAVLAHQPLPAVLEPLQHALHIGINVIPEYYLPPVTLLLADARCGDAKDVLSLLLKTWGSDKVILSQYVVWQTACGSDSDVDAIVTSFRKQFPQDTDVLSK